MSKETLFTVSFSRFAFVFLIFTVITSGYINEILSCQMRYFLSTSLYFRHFLAILMIFVFIMLEGGWSFDLDTDSMDPVGNNWSSGNVVHTLIYATLIYAIFVISSKSRLAFNLIFYTLVLVLYGLNTQRTYLYRRNLITDERNEEILRYEYILLGVASIVLLSGFVDYILYQQKEYGTDFNWNKFIFGTSSCKSLENIKK